MRILWLWWGYVATGVALVLGGILLIAHYVALTAPGSAGAAAMPADAVITDRSAQPSGWQGDRFPTSHMVYRETFTFTDQRGSHSASDEVSAVFYQQHPIGSHVGAYYFPDAPTQAVLGGRERLLPPESSGFPLFGILAIVLGAALALYFGQRLRTLSPEVANSLPAAQPAAWASSAVLSI